MRMLSCADILLLPKDQTPKCVSDDDEVIQMSGELEAGNDALLQITSRLQHHFFCEAFYFSSKSNIYGSTSFLTILEEDFSPPRLHSNFDPLLGGLASDDGFHRSSSFIR